MPANNDSSFFVQGECNCKRCVEERKQAATSTCLKTLSKELPFMPANFDVKGGFNGLGFPGKEKLEQLVDKLIKANEKTLKKEPYYKKGWDPLPGAVKDVEEVATPQPVHASNTYTVSINAKDDFCPTPGTAVRISVTSST